MRMQAVTACLLVGACMLPSTAARADSLSDIFTQGHVDGELRTYYFSRLFGAPNTTDANALAVGALVNLRSGTFANGFDPFIAAQYVTESGGSNNKLVSNNVALFGVAGTRVKNNTWGTDVGVNIPNGRFEVGYNKIAQEAGAVGNGAMIAYKF